jgi:hypothetical protein
MDTVTPNDFAIRYTAAWCSQNAASVAEHFTERGRIISMRPSIAANWNKQSDRCK